MFIAREFIMKSAPLSRSKPKISELRRRLEFVKASFAIEGLEFTAEELEAFDACIRRRLSGAGMRKHFDQRFPVGSAA